MALYKTVSLFIVLCFTDDMWETIIFFLSLSFLRKASQNSPCYMYHETLLRKFFHSRSLWSKGPSSINEGSSSSYLMLWRSKLCQISRGRGVFTVIRHLRVSVGPVVKDQVNQRVSLLTLNYRVSHTVKVPFQRFKGSKVIAKAQWAYRVQS